MMLTPPKDHPAAFCCSSHSAEIEDRTAALERGSADLAMQEALLEARTERDRLTSENERLRADLATFTAEPDIRVGLEAERVSYWYNQTRLMDARAERYRAALEWIAGEGGVGVHTSDCRCATHEASRALAATPEPAPVADGTVEG